MSNTKNSERFFTGVIALTLGNLFVKVLGLALKIPLRNLMTDEGMNYYNNAYNIYATLFSIATTGLPVAVSMMISETRKNGTTKNARRISRIASVMFLIIGLIGTLILIFGAPIFAKTYMITNLEYSVYAVAPTMLFICLASSFRGYFQGYQVMYPTALSEIIESLGKFALGILFGSIAAKQGLPYYMIAAYAAMGISLGVLAGTVYLWISKALFRATKYYDGEELSDEVSPVSEIVKGLLFIALPISLNNSVSSLAGLVDSVFLSRRIQEAGFTMEEMNRMVGNYTTCALPLYNLCLMFVGPITASVIPLLRIAVVEGERKSEERIINGSVFILELIEVPVALGICVLANPIIRFLFGSGSNAEKAAPLLSILAIGAILSAMNSITCTVLHTYKHMKEPVISFTVGALIKMILIYILAGIKSVNVYAAPLSSIVSLVVIVAINLIYIKVKTGFTINLPRIFVKTGISAVICVGAAYAVYYFAERVMSFKLALILGIVVAVPVYVAMILLLKALSRDDLSLIPKGDRIASFLEGHGLMEKSEKQ